MRSISPNQIRAKRQQASGASKLNNEVHFAKIEYGIGSGDKVVFTVRLSKGEANAVRLFPPGKRVSWLFTAFCKRPRVASRKATDYPIRRGSLHRSCNGGILVALFGVNWLESLAGSVVFLIAWFACRFLSGTLKEPY